MEAAHQRRDRKIGDAARRQAEQDEEEDEAQQRRGEERGTAAGRRPPAVPGLARMQEALAFDRGSQEKRQGKERPDQSGGDQRRSHAEMRGEDQHRHRRRRIAEHAGAGMDREGTADARRPHSRREDRIIGRVVDGIGDPQQPGRDEEPGIAVDNTDRGEGAAAEAQGCDQQFARAEAIGERGYRQLHQDRDHGRHGQRQAERDKTDAPARRQQRQQGRHHQHVEMADKMGCRHHPDRLDLAACRASRHGDRRARHPCVPERCF